MARQGPRLTVVATCDGCEHAAIVGAWTFCRSYDPALNNDSDPDSSPGTLYGAPPRTPTWCPKLPAARLAMAREIVAANERNGAPICQRRQEAWDRLTPHAQLATGGTLPCPIPFGPLRIACGCGAERGTMCGEGKTV